MNSNELNSIVDKTVDECKALLLSKGADYSEAGDRLSNFKQGAARLGVTVLQAWGLYFFKHIASIESYVKKGSVQSEPITGRINDAINYLLLLRALIEETPIVPDATNPPNEMCLITCTYCKRTFDGRKEIHFDNHGLCLNRP